MCPRNYRENKLNETRISSSLIFRHTNNFSAAAYNYELEPDEFLDFSSTAKIKHVLFNNYFVGYCHRDANITFDQSGIMIRMEYIIEKIIYFNNWLCISKCNNENGFIVYYNFADCLPFYMDEMERHVFRKCKCQEYINTPGVLKSMCNYTPNVSLRLVCKENNTLYFVSLNRDLDITHKSETKLPKILNIEST